MGARVTGSVTVSDAFLVVGIALAGRRALARSITRLPSALWPPIIVLLGLELLDRAQPRSFFGLRLVVSIVVCMVAIGIQAGVPRHVRQLIHLYAAGAAVSGFVAAGSAVLGLRFRLPGVVDYVGREVGLANHPNHLGLTSLLGLAVALFSDVGRRSLLWRSFFVLGPAAGLLTSGSRAALLGALALVVLLPTHRAARFRPLIVATAAIGAAILLVFAPAIVHRTPALDRLFSGSGDAAENVALSDAGRRELLEASIAQIKERPLLGSGIDNVQTAHNIYLQYLTAGGVVLVLSAIPLIVLALRSIRRGADGGRDPAAVAVYAYLVCGLAQNVVNDRYIYLPFAMAVLCRYPHDPPASTPAARGRRRVPPGARRSIHDPAV
jgi:O-antigen ligase